MKTSLLLGSVAQRLGQYKDITSVCTNNKITNLTQFYSENLSALVIRESSSSI